MSIDELNKLAQIAFYVVTASAAVVGTVLDTLAAVPACMDGETEFPVASWEDGPRL